jgi:putative ABC transport system permease protein
MAFLTQTAGGDDPVTVAVIGVPPGSPALEVVSGRPPGPGEAIVSGDAPFDTGTNVEVGGNPLRVAGRIGTASLNAGMPLVLLPLETFQSSFLGGQQLATAAIVRDPGVAAPDGFRAVPLDEARADTLRILESAIQTIDLIKVLLWTVAALIVGSVVFLSAVERTRDFAVFKAIGASTRSMAGGVALQAAVLSLAATGLGIAVAALLAPVFPLRVTLTFGSLVAMPLIALAIGLLASLFGLRRAVGVEPALAFGGAT